MCVVIWVVYFLSLFKDVGKMGFFRILIFVNVILRMVKKMMKKLVK